MDKKIKNPFPLLLTHSQATTSAVVHTPIVLSPERFGTDTITKRQVISAMQTVPQVKSDQHQ